jgi:cell division protein FtsZ
MTLNLTIPQQTHTDFTPRITVIGVGGGGTNAVDNMIAANLQGVEFVVANTDAQQLMHSRANRRIQLGPHITQGLGAGAKPEIGRAAAEEAADELYRHLDGCHMVFVTAGMGGGTGTGAAPVIARMARERNILTVGVVTKPFSFEGTRRARAADQGIEELQQYVDTLIVIPNQNLFRMANEQTTWREAFKMADQVLYMGVRGVTDLMMAPGLVNLDFADIRTVMAEMGKAMMGTGEAEGENRALRASEAAISNPLLEDTSMSGARGLLINITGGDDMTLFEVDQAANRIREEVDEDANIIFGSSIDESLAGRVRVSVVATGIDTPKIEQARPRLVAVGGGGVAPQPGPIPTGAVAPGQPIAASGQMSTGAVSLRPSLPAGAPGAESGTDQYGGTHIEPNATPPAVHAPVRLTPAGVRPAAAARSGGLFTEPPQDAAPVASVPELARPSLFGTVTGVLLRRRAGGSLNTAGPAVPRVEPVVAEQRPEPSPTVRTVAGDEVGIEIPTFLRRQSS